MSKRELASLTDALSKQFIPKRKTRNTVSIDEQELRANETQHGEKQNRSKDHASIYDLIEEKDLPSGVGEYKPIDEVPDSELNGDGKHSGEEENNVQPRKDIHDYIRQALDEIEGTASFSLWRILCAN